MITFLIIHTLIGIYLGATDIMTRMVNVILSYILYLTLPIYLLSLGEEPILPMIGMISIGFILLFAIFIENDTMRSKLGIKDFEFLHGGGVMDLPLYLLFSINLGLIFHYYGLQTFITFSLIMMALILVLGIVLLLKGHNKIPLFTVYSIMLTITFSFLLLTEKILLG